MKVKGLILTDGSQDILITDGRTLRAMSRQGFFEFPVDGSNNPYVDELDNPRHFEYHGNKYKIKYCSGCFFPFVFRVAT